jgi:hypothetical protein
MSPLEKFFAFNFVSVFSVAILATWFRYLPSTIALYRNFSQSNQPNLKKDLKDNLSF